MMFILAEDLYLNGSPLPYDLTFFTYSRPPFSFLILDALHDPNSRFTFLILHQCGISSPRSLGL